MPINDHIGIKLWMPLQFVLDALQEKRTLRYVCITDSHLCTILLNFDYRSHSRDQAQLSNTLTVNQTNTKQYQEPAQTFLQNLIIFNYFKKVR